MLERVEADRREQIGRAAESTGGQELMCERQQLVQDLDHGMEPFGSVIVSC